MADEANNVELGTEVAKALQPKIGLLVDPVGS
jgi:hypothetical protein